MRVRVGSLEALQSEGRLLAKAGGHGVCVFWADGRAYALDDRCPHMGFPLHRGTVEAGLVTCHWHNARFDLASGGTLDPFADDARAFPVEVEGDDVYLVVEPPDNRAEQLRRRLAEGLEGGLTW
jgi:nitrite reductase/ring-hydroxylating ferredoxin subunit